MRLSYLLAVLTLSLPSCSFASLTTITTPSLPSGTTGTPYSATVVASGGCVPYAWQPVSGILPPGLSPSVSSDTRSESLSGTPTTAGSYSFVISVRGCGHHLSRQSYTLVVSGTTSAHKVTLNWKASTTSGVNYHVYRSTVSGGYYALVGSVAATAYVDPSVAAGMTYFYVASAFDGTGESGYSNQITAVIPSP